MAAVAYKKSRGELETATASEMNSGWKTVLTRVQRKGAVLVTSHNRPEAVILSMDAYDHLVKGAAAAESGNAMTLDALRADFDKRLSALKKPGAADKIRKFMASKTEFKVTPKVGSGR